MTYQLPLPPYLKGWNISAQSLTPMTSDGTGLLTPGTAVNMKTLGIIDTWRLTLRSAGIDIHPTDSTMENFVLAGVDGFDFELGELERSGAPSVLLTNYFNYTYFRFEGDVSDDTGTLVAKLVVLCTRAGGTCEKGMVEGQNGVTATFKPCGVRPYFGNGTPPF